MSFFRAFFVFSLLFVGSAFAQVDADGSKQVKQDPVYKSMEWIEKSRKTIDAAVETSAEPPEWLQGKVAPEAMIAAEKLKKRSDIVVQGLSEGKSVTQVLKEWKEPVLTEREAKGHLEALTTTPADSNLPRSYIFVSQSMPEAELKAALEESTESGATLVYRGIKPGQAIDHISRLIQGIMQKTPGLTPSVMIEPNLFKRYSVETVPSTVVHFNGKIIKASGTMSVDYLLELLEQNKQGYIGVVGTIYDIVEPDFIEEMKRRAELLDWEKITKGAADRFWTHSWDHFDLPVAEKNDSFLIDPSFKVKEDFVALGKVMIKGGTVFNPQKILPMRQVYFIFDGEDKKQIAAVRKYIKRKKVSQDLAILITSSVDRTRGFESLGELNAYFGVQVYLLDKMVTERFKLRSVPSVVYGSGDFYKVEELGMNEISNKELR